MSGLGAADQLLTFDSGPPLTLTSKFRRSISGHWGQSPSLFNSPWTTRLNNLHRYFPKFPKYVAHRIHTEYDQKKKKTRSQGRKQKKGWERTNSQFYIDTLLTRPVLVFTMLVVYQYNGSTDSLKQLSNILLKAISFSTNIYLVCAFVEPFTCHWEPAC